MKDVIKVVVTDAHGSRYIYCEGYQDAAEYLGSEMEDMIFFSLAGIVAPMKCEISLETITDEEFEAFKLEQEESFTESLQEVQS